MDDQLNFNQINWNDGMKINKDHFIGLENYFNACDALIRRSFVGENSYGLLVLSENQKNLEIEAFIDDKKNLKVKVLKCQAITRAGYLININDEIPDKSRDVKYDVETTSSLEDSKDTEFYLIISVDPFARIPVGQAVSSESPLRQPYVIPEYKLQIVQASSNISKNLSQDSLPLGKISVENLKPEIDPSYIPPCTSINGHVKLQEFIEFTSQGINALEKNVVELIAEINLKATSKPLVQIILYVAENLLFYLNDKISVFKWMLKSQPPVHLVAVVKSMAHTIKNAIDVRTPEERELLLNYFSEHFDINPAKFKQLLDVTIGIDYQHTEINLAIEKVEDFINVISLLFNELKKMEFIGGVKRKKKIDIIIH